MIRQTPYGPLSARLYDCWFSSDLSQDESHLLALVRGKAGHVLELGCGTGRLLLPLVKEGRTVDGVDASTAMLDICRGKLSALGVRACLVNQSLQALDLDQQYDVIFASLGTVQLITSNAEVMQTLTRIRKHMVPGGILIFGLFTPEPSETESDQSSWRVRRQIEMFGGGTATCLEQLTWDHNKRIRAGRFRYELRDATGALSEQEEEALDLRWYSPVELAGLLDMAGFARVLFTDIASDRPAWKDERSFLAHAYA